MAGMFAGQDRRPALQRIQSNVASANAAAAGNPNIIRTESVGDVARRVVGGGAQRPTGLRGASQADGIAGQIAKLDEARNREMKSFTNRGQMAFKSATFNEQRSGLVDQLKEAGADMGRQGVLGNQQEANAIQREDLGLRRNMAQNDALSGLIGASAQPSSTGEGDEDDGGSTPAPMPPIVRNGNSFSFARGGKINGPGTSKSDSIPAYLSDGEYVLPAETVKQLGTGKLNNLVRQTTGHEPGPGTKKGMRGFNAGGRVRHQTDPGVFIDEEPGRYRSLTDPGVFVNDQQPPQTPFIPAPVQNPASAAPVRAPTPQGIIGAPPAPTNEQEWRNQHAAADVYRTARQDRGRGGMRNADDTDMTLYNAENYTRGTGIQANRQANGVIEFSDKGLRRTAQHLGANGAPTDDWTKTSQYRDAMMRNAASDNPALQRQGLLGLARIEGDNQAEVRGRSTGNAAFDKRRAAGVSDELNATMLQRDTGNELAERQFTTNAELAERQHALRGMEVAYQNAPKEATAEERNAVSERRLARLDKQIDRIGPLDDKDRGAFRSFIAENFGDQIFDLSPEEQAVAIEKLFPQFAARKALAPFIVSGENNRSAPQGFRKDAFGLFNDDKYPNKPSGWKRLMSGAGDIMELKDGSRIDMIGLRGAVKGDPMEAEILKQFEIPEQ